MVGAEGAHLTLSVDALGENTGSDRLADLRRQLLDALRLVPAGPVAAITLQCTSLTADSAAEAIKLEYARKVDPLHPGQTRQQRRNAMEQAEGNRTISRMVKVWEAVHVLLTPGGPETSGWLELGVEQGEHGPVRVLRIKGRKHISDGFKAPTLLLDALLAPELVLPFWPDFKLTADVQAATPHQHIRQVTDKAYSLSMLEPLSDEAAKADPKEAARRANRLRDLRATLVREARHYAPGVVLVVMQQAVEKAMLALGPLPPNVQTAHHNAIAGRDEWKDVRALIVVGRTMPPPSGVERIADAVTGRATPAPMQWYERADAVREMADGSTIPAEADRHTDPIADLVRWQIAEGEIVQIIGRPRGVNRSAANPVDVLVLTDVPLPMPLAGTLIAADLEPSILDLMLSAGGVALENARHMASAYSGLWTTHKAAAKALERERSSPFPYNSISIGERGTPLACGGRLLQVGYQLVGAGQKPAIGWFDPALCPDPEAFLTSALSALGSLAWCKVEDVPPPEPEPPSAPVITELNSDKANVPERTPVLTCDVLSLPPRVPAYAGAVVPVVVRETRAGGPSAGAGPP